jgi:hypothetical protein
MAVGPTEIALATEAPDYRLPATNDRTYALKDVAGEHGHRVHLQSLSLCHSGD